MADCFFFFIRIIIQKNIDDEDDNKNIDKFDYKK